MNTRRVVMRFEGTSREFRAWLNQLSTLVDDEAYQWELTASIARHPAGKGLGCAQIRTDGWLDENRYPGFGR